MKGEVFLSTRIQELRKSMGMTQREFAKFFDIPLGTVRNWEQNIAASPPYVLKMIEFGVRRDGMINIETLKFIKLLESLKKKTAVGIKPFSAVSAEDFDCIVTYDDSQSDEEGNYKIVSEACFMEDHHDIMAYYEDTDEYEIRVQIEDGAFVAVKMKKSDTLIIIENGEWYFA